jgi:hypothetical protein
VKAYCEFKGIEPEEYVDSIGNKLARSYFSSAKRESDNYKKCFSSETDFSSYEHKDATIDKNYLLGATTFVSSVVTRIHLSASLCETEGACAPAFVRKMASLRLSEARANASAAFKACYSKPLHLMFD